MCEKSLSTWLQFVIIDNNLYFCSAELLGRDHLKPLSLCLYKYLNSSSKPANQSVIQNVCQVTDDVIGCLAIEKHNQLQMYVSIVKRIAGYLERLKEQVCSNGMIATESKKKKKKKK